MSFSQVSTILSVGFMSQGQVPPLHDSKSCQRQGDQYDPMPKLPGRLEIVYTGTGEILIPMRSFWFPS